MIENYVIKTASFNFFIKTFYNVTKIIIFNKKRNALTVLMINITGA